MDNTELLRTGRTIDNLAGTYERIIFDTSALEATHAPRDLKKAYKRELREAIKRYKNIHTIDEVFIESRVVQLNSPHEMGIRKIRQDLYEPFFSQFFDYLEPKANEEGLVGPRQAFYQTDVKLASLVFAMSAKEPERTLFASSDRALLDFVDLNANVIRSNEKGLPTLQGRIILYTFIQKFAQFFPHTKERSYRKRLMGKSR